MLRFERRLKFGKEAEALFDIAAKRMGLKILHVGYEVWNGREAIDALKFMHDPTSKFLRSLPDRGILTPDSCALADVKSSRAFNLCAFKHHKRLAEALDVQLFYIFKLDSFRVISVSDLKPDVIFCLPGEAEALRREFGCEIVTGAKYASAFGLVEERTWRRWPTLETWAKTYRSSPINSL